MPPATFIDANVPIYAAGREHPYREPCIRVLEVRPESPMLSEIGFLLRRNPTNLSQNETCCIYHHAESAINASVRQPAKPSKWAFRPRL